MPPRKPAKNPPRIGPGKRIVSIYADAAEIEQFKERAKSLGLSLSQYFAALAVKDLEKGDDAFELPQRPTVDETALKLAKLASEQITAKRKK